MVDLIVVEGSRRRVVPLGSPITTIGRSPKNTIALHDPRSSRFHCQIERCAEGHDLVDVGSQNGTYVNGLVVTRKRLEEGDRIEIGGARLFYGQEAEDAEVAHTQVADVEDLRNQNLQKLIRDRGNLAKLQRLTAALNSELDLRRLLELIIESAIDLTDAERGFVIVGRGDRLDFEAARNFERDAVANPQIEVSRSIARSVLERGEPVLSLNALDDQRFEAIQSVSELALRSVLCHPIRGQDGVVGVLYLDNRLQKGVFTEEDLHLVEAVAGQAAIAIRNARQVIELKAAREEVEALNRELLRKVETQGAELAEARERLRKKETEPALRHPYDEIIGRCPAMVEMLRLLDRIIDTDAPILIQGESGTGKELIARALHHHGPRKSGPFVSENVAALPETLLESELFGYRKGAFTGADRDKKGLFEIAHQGTLFLDELGNMSIEMQKKLLRVLQEKEIRPVGARDVVKVDVRILSASNTDLAGLVEEGRFREDLYYRLKVFTVEVPPLRRRKEDLPALLHHFLRLYSGKTGTAVREVDADVLPLLQAYDWPGNVREFENEVRKMIAMSDRRITRDVVSESIRRGRPAAPAPGDPASQVRNLNELVDDVERSEIRKALEAAGGNKTRAATLLGVSRFTLQRKLEKFGMGE